MAVWGNEGEGKGRSEVLGQRRGNVESTESQVNSEGLEPGSLVGLAKKDGFYANVNKEQKCVYYSTSKYLLSIYSAMFYALEIQPYPKQTKSLLSPRISAGECHTYFMLRERPL